MEYKIKLIKKSYLCISNRTLHNQIDLKQGNIKL